MKPTPWPLCLLLVLVVLIPGSGCISVDRHCRGLAPQHVSLAAYAGHYRLADQSRRTHGELEGGLLADLPPGTEVILEVPSDQELVLITTQTRHLARGKDFDLCDGSVVFREKITLNATEDLSFFHESMRWCWFLDQSGRLVEQQVASVGGMACIGCAPLPLFSRRTNVWIFARQPPVESPPTSGK